MLGISGGSAAIGRGIPAGEVWDHLVRGMGSVSAQALEVV